MGKHVSVGNLADAIMEGLEEYASLATSDMKEAVKDAGNLVKKEISTNAPKDTGDYAKSWTVKKTRETSTSLELMVHSKNKYQMAHLLEKGHANRNGGRTEAQPHIAPAEEKGIEQLENQIRKALGG